MVHVVEGDVRPGHAPRTSDKYERKPTVFRAGRLPDAPQAVEPGRLHLVVCAACPWAHRTLLVRQLKGLDRVVGLSVVSPIRDDDVGWHFATEEDAERFGSGQVTSPTKDRSGNDAAHLYELYLLADAKYSGNVTTPVLFDTHEGTIVSNDSWEIVRYLDRALEPGPHAAISYSLYPEASADGIDEVAQRVQDMLNNGVYKCGLARSQEAYEAALDDVFDCLEELEARLAGHRYLAGRNDRLSVADVQLFPTLARFDDVYSVLFKCSKRRLSSFHHLSNYARDFYQLPGVAATVDAHQVKAHYYTTFTSANPNKVVPLGSAVPSFARPHDRAQRFAPERASAGADRRLAVEEQQRDKAARQASGEFVRGVSQHRNVVTRAGDGGDFPAESGRYHLYIANNCPWCHRVMLARAILGLEEHISVSVLFYRRDEERGWQFLPAEDKLRDAEVRARDWLLDGKVDTEDKVNGVRYIRELYEREDSSEKSVPVLFDKKSKRIVSNESADIARMFAQGFGELHRLGAPDLYPAELADDVDELNSWIYPDINNGAYKAGFSSAQDVYEAAFKKYFEAFDRLEGILASRRFLTGDQPTEADVRLFPTIARHDPVYYRRMKLNDRMVRDCPNLQRWLRDMYAQPGVKDATNIHHCIWGYFGRTGNNLIPAVELDTEWF